MSNLVKTPERLKQSILQEAMQGKLTNQLPSDGNVDDLLIKLANYKRNLVQNGKLGNYPKSLPPIKSKVIPFKIPNNWKWIRLSNLSPITLGKTPARHNISYWKNGTIPWVSIADLNNSFIKITKEKITKKASNKVFHNNITPAGSLLMSFKLTIGKMGILKYPAYHNEAIVSFSFFTNNNYIKKTLRNYLYFILPLMCKFVRSTSAIKGNTLNKSKLIRMLIPLPPLAEQHRIVQRLNEILPAVDDLNKDVVELDQIRTKFPHRLKQSLLLEAMKGHLTQQLPSDGNADDLLQSIQQKKQHLIQAGKIRKHKKLPPISKDEIPFKIPKNWKWTRFVNICDYIQKGRELKHGDTNKFNTGIPALNQKSIQLDGIHYSYHKKNVSLKIFHKYSKIRILKPNDILLNCTGTGTVGRSAIVPKKLIQQHNIIVADGYIMVIRTNHYISSKFTFLFLSSPLVKRYIQKKITGATNQMNLNLYAIKPIIIPLPPLPEQHRIVSKLHDLFNTINE